MRTPPVLFAFLLACGGATEPTPATGATTTTITTTTTPASTTTTATTTTTPGSFSALEVHEWALVDVAERGLSELAGGPGHPPPEMAVRKPVFYVHLPDGTDSATFTLEARMANGTILEHWPAGTITGSAVRWDVTAARAHCSTVVPTTRGPIPADGVAELPDLPTYDAADAACVTVGATSAGLLFYRGSLSAPTLPLTVSRASDMTVTVTATGDTSGAPGEVLRLSTSLSGPWPLGHVVISRIPMPARGDSVTMPLGEVGADAGVEGEHLAEAMLALGMTRPEADAFVTAWREALFGTGIEAARELRDERFAMAARMPQDAIVYWLPPAAVDTIATSTVTPAATMRRAFLVRVALPAVATADLGTPRETYAARWTGLRWSTARSRRSGAR